MDKSNVDVDVDSTVKPTIKHLVLCGGGPSVYRSIGALYYLEDHNFWSIDNIETIFGTSAGAILGAMLCLRFDHDTITNYLINRPWHEAFPIKASQIMELFLKKGLYDYKIIDVMFKPLLNAKDLPLTITMKELYEYSKIHLHMYSLELNSFKIEDISYKTHPDLPLLDAISMSCAIPTLFAPHCKDNCCYVDGGVISNYPLSYCLEFGHKKEEILGVRFNYVNQILDEEEDADNGLNSPLSNKSLDKGCKKEEDKDKGKDKDKDKGKDTSIITQSSNILEFLLSFLAKVILQIGTEFKQDHLPYELILDTTQLSYHNFKKTLYSLSFRKKMVDSGAKVAKAFLEKLDIDITPNI
jgi:predicted acylesterase/phospholipase RssA